MWMAADARSVLSLGVFSSGDGSLGGDRWREFLLLTPIFVFSSWKVGAACEDLTGIIVGEGSEMLPVGAVKEKSPDGKWKPSRKLNGGLGDPGVRFTVLLGALWVLNLVSLLPLQVGKSECVLIESRLLVDEDD